MNSAGDALWSLHIGGLTTGTAQLIDLSKIPPEMREVERKYRLPSAPDVVNESISALFAQIGSFVAKKKLSVVSTDTFVGIDQYYVYKVGGREFQFRYRSGANRSPQVTVKYQLENGSNLTRGEININVGNTDPNKVRAFMSVLAEMSATPPIIFLVQQSGQIWVVRDPKTGKRMEIVVYRVRRFEPTPLEGAFVEIEALDFEDMATALATIMQYEVGLGLGSSACERSIAEMFRPGNEKL